MDAQISVCIHQMHASIYCTTQGMKEVCLCVKIKYLHGSKWYP